MEIRITMKNGREYRYFTTNTTVKEHVEKWKGVMQNETNPLWAIGENVVISLNEVMTVEKIG